jgi:hypothetical protein
MLKRPQPSTTNSVTFLNLPAFHYSGDESIRYFLHAHDAQYVQIDAEVQNRGEIKLSLVVT